jgi:hypothetical protein
MWGHAPTADVDIEIRVREGDGCDKGIQKEVVVAHSVVLEAASPLWKVCH